jgi:alpha-L-fucosidase
VGHYDKELLGDYQSMTDNGMPIGGIEEYWETPQTLNDTWGYSQYDQNWKSPQEIIRRMVTIVSKGGNYLLNVGPTGKGVIPEPSVRILTEVGRWMEKNNTSIYGTSPSPFPYEMPWGYCTRKDTLLYLHVFDWPEDEKLIIEGLNNKINRAYMLVNPANKLTIQKQDGWLISLPKVPTDTINSVVVAEIEGFPDVDPFIIQQQSDESILLDYLSASTHGKAVKRFNRKGESGHFHISKMQSPADYVEWYVKVSNPGVYYVDLTYAAIQGWENADFLIDSGEEQITETVKSSSGWYEYKTERVGKFNITKTGNFKFKIYPKDILDHYLMYFK